MTSVVVIGGGIAGYCAALGARREGAEVTVVAKAPGATALYAGAMEVVDDLEAMLKNEPHHPFSRLGMDPNRGEFFKDAVKPVVCRRRVTPCFVVPAPNNRDCVRCHGCLLLRR